MGSGLKEKSRSWINWRQITDANEKNWCQTGVKLLKNEEIEDSDTRKPLILLGLQKKLKNLALTY